MLLWSNPSCWKSMAASKKSVLLSTEDHQPEGFRWLTLKRIKSRRILRTSRSWRQFRFRLGSDLQTYVQYKDPSGRERQWESAERVHRKGAVDGVAIIAQVVSDGKPTQLILESQFRPSQGSYVIEFPAGLVDEGESPEEAAARELKEETGYTGRVLDVSSIGYSDPGMSNSNYQAVTIRVDADSPENQNVSPQLEEGEFIEVFLLPYKNLYKQLQDLQRDKGWDVDARLLMYAMGLAYSRLD